MALSAPLTAVHFGSVSVVSPISNILCLWIVSAVYIGGYIIVLLGAFLPGAAALAGSVLAWGVRYILRGVRLPLTPPVRERLCAQSALSRLARARIRALFRRVAALSENRALPCLAPICVSLALLFAAAGITRLNGAIRSVSRRSTSGRGMHRSHERGACRGDRLRRKLGHARRREKRRAVSRRRVP